MEQTPAVHATLRRYAMRSGFFVGLVMSANFVIGLIFPTGLLASGLSLFFIFLVPILMVRFALVVRKQVLGNSMNWGEAFAFLTYQLLFALVPYALFVYLFLIMPQGIRAMETALEVWNQVAQQNPTFAEGVEQMRNMTKIEITFMYLFSNLLGWSVFNLICAFFIQKK